MSTFTRVSKLFSAIAIATTLAGCAGATMAEEPPATTATTSASLAATTPALPVPKAAVPAPDYSDEEEQNASAVFDGLRDDFRACYIQRLAVNPKAHAFMTFDVVIGPEGHVRNVETTGGANLGDATIKCLVAKVDGATFMAPHGGGTLRIHMPLELVLE